VTDMTTGLGLAHSFVLDPDRSRVHFRARKLGFVPVRGSFGNSLVGGLQTRGDLLEAWGSVDAREVSSGRRKRDDHLRSPDFLDADEHCELTLAIDGVVVPARDAAVDARLTLKGVTRMLPLSVSVERHDEGLRVTARGEADRRELGINPPLPWDRIVGRRVRIDLELVATEEVER
jgi:polyisoprenoid-binding protein YceI